MAIVARPAALFPVSWKIADVTVQIIKTKMRVIISMYSLSIKVRLTEKHAGITDQEKLPATNPINKKGTCKSHDEVEDLKDAIDEGLGSCIFDSDGLRGYTGQHSGG
jgi:hypothetical protein